MIKVLDVSESKMGVQVVLETAVISPVKTMDIQITKRMTLLEKQLRLQIPELSGLSLTQVDHFEEQQQWSFTSNE